MRAAAILARSSEGAAPQVAAAPEALAFRTAHAYPEVIGLTELMRIGEENFAAHERALRKVSASAKGGVGRNAGAPRDELVKRPGNAIEMPASGEIGAEGAIPADDTAMGRTATKPAAACGPSRPRSRSMR